MTKRSGRFSFDMLINFGSPPPDVPPLGIGDRCMLNSGGPVMTVVDMNADDVVVAWRGEAVTESTFPRACVRRISGRSGR